MLKRVFMPLALSLAMVFGVTACDTHRMPDRNEMRYIGSLNHNSPNGSCSISEYGASPAPLKNAARATMHCQWVSGYTLVGEKVVFDASIGVTGESWYQVVSRTYVSPS